MPHPPIPREENRPECLGVSRGYVPIVRLAPGVPALVPRARSARGARRLGRPRAAGRRLRGARRSAAGGGPRDRPRGRRALRDLRHLPRARRRAELHGRDHRVGRPDPARRLVPGQDVRLAARSARDPHRCRAHRCRSPSPRLRRGVPRPAGARRLHQRDRRPDHRRADPEAPRHLGRERQRARDGLARDRRARRHQLGHDPRRRGLARSRCSSAVGSRRSCRGR